MVAHADGPARYRGGAETELTLRLTRLDGIDQNAGSGVGNWHGDWIKVESVKGWASVYNLGRAAGSSLNGYSDVRGGPWVPRWGTSRGFNSAISDDYDDLEIPTYMVKNGSHWVMRYADGSIIAGFIHQLGNHRLEGLSRPLDPEVPNAGQTWNGQRRPNDEWALTSAGASVMFKSWLERTGAVDLFSMPSSGSALEGQFVGQDADGPTGMIGTWELPAGVFGVGDVRERIQGSFGAEYAP